MTTHILAITYPPKIEGVRNGTIRQTIRLFNPANPRKVGDKLLLHGWSGKPYRSPWNWRREEIVDYIIPVGVSAKGLRSLTFPRVPIWRWDEPEGVPEILARLDGISPPTGMELKHVLESYHGKFTDKPVQMQVIRW